MPTHCNSLRLIVVTIPERRAMKRAATIFGCLLLIVVIASGFWANYSDSVSSIPTNIASKSVSAATTEIDAERFIVDLHETQSLDQRIKEVPTATPLQSNDIVAQWEQEHTDATTRALQIAAFIAAPREIAISNLKRVMVAGDNDDRLLALQAFVVIAQKQGDADESVRNALRDLLYHEDISPSVQPTLDKVEQAINL